MKFLSLMLVLCLSQVAYTQETPAVLLYDTADYTIEFAPETMRRSGDTIVAALLLTVKDPYLKAVRKKKKQVSFSNSSKYNDYKSQRQTMMWNCSNGTYCYLMLEEFDTTGKQISKDVSTELKWLTIAPPGGIKKALNSLCNLTQHKQ